jgi:divalent metal cation (Fe/Co/Zn/Cd) transporter
MFQENRLRSAALTVAVLVLIVSVVLALTALLRLLLLTRLPTVLALPGLTALLTLFLGIVCHGLLLLKRVNSSTQT